jgi:hypothetical protein
MSLEDAKTDLRFVRETVQRAESPNPPALYLLWAAIMLAGSMLADFRPLWVAGYWLVAAPVGFVLSAVLGHQWHRHIGQLSVEAGRREFLHWTALLGATALAVLLVVADRLTPQALGSVILLLVALTYIQAGIHLHRRLVWVGIVISAAYVVTLFAGWYEWTLAGVLITLALAGQAFVARRADASNR